MRKQRSNLAIAPQAEVTNVSVGALPPSSPKDVPGSPPEPVYTSEQQDDIQGNVIPGFNKDHQHFLFYKIRNVDACKRFLKWLAPQLTSMEEAIAFRRRYQARRLKFGHADIHLCSTWINVGFSHGAVARLHSEADANAFGDESFRQGLAERSTYLGDPTAKASRGHRSRWVVGGPKNEADIIIIVASDTPSMLEDVVTTIRARAHRDDLEVVFEQRARPGQFLVWPGQVLLGEERQSTEDHVNPVPGATNFPDWARRGSYLAVRRLQQDVRFAHRARPPNADGACDGPDPPCKANHRNTASLMCLCYGATIEDQFELPQRSWSHSKLEEERMIPTGGGYFFSPVISAVANVLGGA